MQHPLILILIGSVVSSYNMGIVPCLYFVCICQVLTTVLKNFLHTLMSLTALSVLSSHKVLLLWLVTSTLIFLFSVLHLTNRVENFLLLLTVTTYTLFHAQTSLLVQITPIFIKIHR